MPTREYTMRRYDVSTEGLNARARTVLATELFLSRLETTCNPHENRLQRAVSTRCGQVAAPLRAVFL